MQESIKPLQIYGTKNIEQEI